MCENNKLVSDCHYTVQLCTYSNYSKQKAAPPVSIIKLYSSHPDHFRSDELYKLIPEILNPKGVYYMHNEMWVAES